MGAGKRGFHRYAVSCLPMNCTPATKLQHSPELSTVCPQNALVSHQALPKVAEQVSHQALPKLSNCPKLSTLTCTTAQTGHKHHAMRFPDTLQGLEERNPGKVAPREDDATMFPSTFHRHPTQSRHTFHRHPPHSTDTLQGLKEKKPGRSCTKQREDNGTMQFPLHKGTMRFPPHSTDTLQGLEERKPATVECRWRVALLRSVQH